MYEMDEKEATAILSILKAAYPNSYKDITKKQANGVIATWATQLSDVPVEIVFLAIEKLISTCKFPPTIAEVRTKIKRLHNEAIEICLSENKQLLPEPLVSQAERICLLTRGFKEEPSLYGLMKNCTVNADKFGISTGYLLETVAKDGLTEDKNQQKDDE